MMLNNMDGSSEYEPDKNEGYETRYLQKENKNIIR